MSPFRIVALAFALLLVLAGTAVATTKQVIINSPVDGTLWSSPLESPPHHIHWGQWAADIQTFGQGRPVYARFGAANGDLTLAVTDVNGESCGSGVGGSRVTVRAWVDGVLVGEIRYLHLAGVIGTGPIANGRQIGTTATGLPDNRACWTGPHVHVEPVNRSGGSSCFRSIPLHTALDGSSAIGVLGGEWTSGNHQVCPPAAFDVDGTPSPPPDGDGDGVPDASDRCIGRVGLAGLSGCPAYDREVSHSSDFDGDGRSDVAAFYDYGGGSLGIFVHRGAASLDPVARRIQLTGAGQWELDRTRLVAGDFDGDGRSDVAAFYDYGGGNLGIFVHRGTAAGLDPVARRIQLTGAGQWELDRTRLVAGDFDGDGRSDVAAFYDYGGGNLGIFVHRGTAAGLDPVARRIQLTGAGQWESDRARLTAGDFDGDGRTDVAAFYDYGGANLGIFVFRGTAA
ncbi:MAG: FG-GAP repeat domain-containing protein, partial [Thermoleophilia bacterium]